MKAVSPSGGAGNTLNTETLLQLDYDTATLFRKLDRGAACRKIAKHVRTKTQRARLLWGNTPAKTPRQGR